ncbi:hypothetical protein [Halobacillus massiliensis]|uniref:hypothetical protein n=1 Tax=Halobacillus massiliensis TaxID=1926286 RepID=UPI0009E4DB54|nr:hypothetical protein [Halobacillus massiliensis]
MKRKRTGEVDFKVFKKKDILSIARYILEAQKEIIFEESEERVRLNFKIDFANGTSVESDEIIIFEEAETKIINSIQFILRDSDLKKQIYVAFDTQLKYAKYIVEGEDKNWVDAKFSQIEEIITVVPNQNYWLSETKRQAVISNFSGMSIGLAFYFLFFRRVFEEDILRSNGIAFAVLLLALFMGQLFGHFLWSRLYKLYPSIEFDIADDHINRDKQKKKIILQTTILILFPLIISFVTSLIF